MSAALVLTVLRLLPLTLTAHPGSGLEVAADGTMYVADVGSETIWRVAPDGSVSPLVTNSWTHEMQLLADGTLLYEREHTGYEQAPQSLRTIAPDGQRAVLIQPPPDRGRFGSNAFCRGPNGVVTFAHTVRGEDGKWRAIIRQRDADDHDGSRVRTVAGATEGGLYLDGPAMEATFRMIVDMRLLADGTIVLLDRDRVRRMTPTEDGSFTVTTQGPSLIDAKPADPPTRGGPETTWNRLYGLAVDAEGNALVAYNAGRRVLRIAPDGTLTTLHTSDDDWAPVGVAIGPSGRVHISEISDRGGRIRVARVENGEASVVASIPAV
ncbi:MAG: hypothetical protein NCW75_09320 [Phycisphaera sp.]|nr:MAG: hypothetical protein NCW75_09320 [Phycisphaera sp.]